MVTFLPSLLIATLMGLLAGMGVGGGSLLILWLTQVAMLPQQQAKLINLLFFLPAAVISTLFRRKQKQLHKAVTLPAIVAGCAAAVIGALLSRNLDVSALKSLLGVLLILTGLREVFYRPRKAK